MMHGHRNEQTARPNQHEFRHATVMSNVTIPSGCENVTIIPLPSSKASMQMANPSATIHSGPHYTRGASQDMLLG